MKSLLLPIAAVPLAACAAGNAAAPETTGCDVARAQPLIGRPASAELAAQARRLTGAAVVRWLVPGQIVTMEFRADRLNIVLDGNNRVEAIRCG